MSQINRYIQSRLSGNFFSKVMHLASGNTMIGSTTMLGLILIIHVMITFLYPLYISFLIARKKKWRLFYPSWIKIIR